MKGFRFSLGSMFLGVAAVSLACAALVKPNWIWVLTLQAASLGVLTLALLAALVYQRDAARAFWIGFAVVGWGYLGLQRLHLTEVSLSGEVSEWLLDVIHPYPPSPANSSSDQSAGQPQDNSTDPYAYSHDPDPAIAWPNVRDARYCFPYVIAWIWPTLLGVIGGVVAQQLCLRRERLAARQSASGSGPI